MELRCWCVSEGKKSKMKEKQNNKKRGKKILYKSFSQSRCDERGVVCSVCGVEEI